MAVDSRISNKFAVISFIAAWSVLAWHCYCGSLIERWFIPMFCYWSVPWFFFCSGFFLFNSWGTRSIQMIIVRKVMTLVVPYVFWCLFGLMMFLVLSGSVGDVDIVKTFALGRFDTSPTYNKPLWYLRALIIFLSIGLPVRLLIDKMEIRNVFLAFSLFSIVFLGAVVFINCRVIRIYGPGTSPFYFLIGIWSSMADKYKDMKMIKVVSGKVQNSSGVCLVLALLGYLATRFTWFSLGNYFGSSVESGNILSNVATVFFIVALWFGIDMVPNNVMRNLSCVGGVFAYFFHRPILDWCRVAIVPILKGNEGMINLFFVSLVIFYFPCCLMLARIIEKITPQFYSLIIGGRR